MLKVAILTVILKNYIVLELFLYLASTSIQKPSFHKESRAEARKVGAAALQTSKPLKKSLLVF